MKEKRERDCRASCIYLFPVQGHAQRTNEGQLVSNCLDESYWGGPTFPLTSNNETEEMASVHQIGKGRRETNTVC